MQIHECKVFFGMDFARTVANPQSHPTHNFIGGLSSSSFNPLFLKLFIRPTSWNKDVTFTDISAASRYRSKNPRRVRRSCGGGIPAATARRAAPKTQPPVSGGLHVSRCEDCLFSSNGAARQGTLRSTTRRARICPVNPVLPVPAPSRSCRDHRMYRVCQCPTR